MKIGVLALQGNYSEHYNKISRFGEVPIYIKDKSTLFKCDGLIIPGGESTVISKMLDYNGLRKSILEIKDKINIMGVCAGMIMLSQTTKYENLKPLSIMDFEVKRNGYGRQINSFNSLVELSSGDSVSATFIRAPKIISWNKSIKCLAKFNNDPVLITDGKHLASSFHPEYSLDFSVYNYFKQLIEK